MSRHASRLGGTVSGNCVKATKHEMSLHIIDERGVKHQHNFQVRRP